MQQNPDAFLKLPRSLLSCQIFKSLPTSYKWVIICMYELAAYTTTTLDDHGILVTLQPGQLMITHRQLANYAGVDKNIVSRALEKTAFMQKVTLEVRHTKTIITLLDYVTNKTEKNLSETRSETSSGQLWGRNKEIRTKENNNNNNPVLAAKIERVENQAIAADNRVFFSSELSKMVNLTPDRIATLQRFYPDVDVKREVLRFEAYYHARPEAAGKVRDWYKALDGWISRSWRKRITPRAGSVDDNKDFVCQRFKNGETYNGAECFVSETAVAFQRGMTHKQLYFKDKGFKEQFEHLVRTFVYAGKNPKIENLVL